MGGTLTRDFFDRPSQQVAPDLLGCLLTCNGVSVLLTETEAYAGEVDPASHAYRGRTQRNAVMFGPPGHAYVYFTYGMHFCVNLVCMPAGTASAVLLRAGEVVAGESVAAARRGPGVRLRDLARGPARLCQALGIDRSWNGTDACDPASGLRLAPPSPPSPPSPGETSRGPVHSGPRVGVREGAQVPWRFWLDGDPSVSVYRPHVPRVRSSRKRLPVGRAGVAQCLL